ncbi:hypothetical protein GALMADRAFT_234678 [Galerina marginata CBS 339.88]|uniref:F-box domain-containing protein n=1 Tax=Galerina marginata (strain CBS 339.88) TaxID=685588 RepID=A0A067U2P8_GALM3|nr:hypothetical protein GALMADRAFT_234678 [Galerina marginata CBS 339.88]
MSPKLGHFKNEVSHPASSGSREKVNSDTIENRLRRQKVRKVQSPNLSSKAKDDAVVVNSSGLAIFPDELLLEILGHYPEIPFPTVEQQEFNANDHIARRETLLALSKTCRNLRRFFRPYIWHRIEVCAGMRVENHILQAGQNLDKVKFNLELVRQLEIVTIRDPTLAEYVTVINVEVKDYSVGPLLAELARSISLFPNLHTVKLQVTHHLNSDVPTRKAFSKYSYPQIRSLILCRCAYPLLRSCPQARSIRTTEKYPSLDLMPAMLGTLKFPCLEELEIRIPFDHLEVIVEAFPGLRTVVLRFCNTLLQSFGYPELLAPIHRLRRLNSITIWTFSTIQSPLKQEITHWASQLLLALQKEDKEDKKLVVLDQEFVHDAPIRLVGKHVYLLPALKSCPIDL